MKYRTHRVRPPAVPPEVQQIRQAGEELGQHAARAPTRARVIFQTVSEVAIVGSITASGLAALYHLWEKATRRPDHHGHEPGQQEGDDQPPRRHGAVTAGHSR